ncbi:ABC transporter, ATP-binding protein [Ligilactobacillus apodemi DSM 16634 = JCM 16172]|uniref:ABC transporter, ATP-binding protein n=2 Tax=Ligilactobacillus TaxID=2767887 RepID=A0A0R1TQ65_9LACO|nr:ABC transporter ATP-binding protein [Ligilactobacillus apodemi]KRL83597.1 ABC transporter, ATP-binding protein [Ligilactobacillus apodemi DSM 16634 = JCM 16172]MBD5069521.1 ABC transporter ATP-binding protein [Lactobacillus sp.]MCR1900445.1 ABC transporter ATP-binding protein [Ligilactobacillus apodemi]
MTLKVENLVGGYSQVPVLKDISFEVKQGQLVGLIGLNGAGKSTTIKHIIGLLQPQKGKITIDGVSLKTSPQVYKQKMAYIPETPILYEELTLKEHLELTMMAYCLETKQAWEKANKLLKTFRLENKLDWFPANFSKGMKQKVMIVCAFITEASLYIIDEPFLGLDPLATKDLLDLIAQKKTEGAAVLMSTHVLSTAQEYCDSFVMIDQGQLTAKGNLADLRQQFSAPKASLSEIYLELARVGERNA